jgi:hypothetical protein
VAAAAEIATLRQKLAAAEPHIRKNTDARGARLFPQSRSVSKTINLT